MTSACHQKTVLYFEKRGFIIIEDSIIGPIGQELNSRLGSFGNRELTDTGVCTGTVLLPGFRKQEV